ATLDRPNVHLLDRASFGRSLYQKGKFRPRARAVLAALPGPESTLLATVATRFSDLLDSIDCAADTTFNDLAAPAIPHSFLSRRGDPGLLGGNLMKRTLLVLALVVCAAVGCRA